MVKPTLLVCMTTGATEFAGMFGYPVEVSLSIKAHLVGGVVFSC